MRNSVADLLRLVAALLVTIGHAGPFLLGTSSPLVGLGMPAVMMFFAVSGYSIAIESKRADFSFHEYALRRVTRLWVVLIPAMLLTAVLDISGIFLFGNEYGPRFEWSSFASIERLGPLYFLGTAGFLNTFLVDSYGSNSALWSLSLEFWCYMAFYFRRTLWAPLILVGCTALYPTFAVMAAIWALGARAAYAKERPSVAFAALFCLAILLPTGDRLMGQWMFYFAVGSLTACVVAFSKPFTNSAVTFFSGSTYSLYAVHYPILLLLSFLLPHAKPYFFLGVLIALISSFVFSRLTEAHTGTVRRSLEGHQISLFKRR